uniref:Uncharacterized protein n=1 Tax=Plectus sambesii TaxID=2011161 RepID=A0A914VVC8_9BILA
SSGGEYDGTLYHPRYLILQKMAELYRRGGYGLAKNAQRAGELYNEAAEAAMEAMKGKLANKMYQMAEEAFAEIEEEE